MTEATQRGITGIGTVAVPVTDPALLVEIEADAVIQ